MTNRLVGTHRGYEIQETDTRGHIGYAIAVAPGLGNLIQGYASIEDAKAKIDQIIDGTGRGTRR